MANALVPASATTRWPAGSKVTAKGTVSAAPTFTTGEGESSPKRPTPNTSMSLPLALVVTISWEPSGEKATWPGCWVNWCRVDGMARPRFRFDPGRGNRCPKKRDVALDAPAVQGVEDVDEVAVDGHAHREVAAGADDLAQGELVAADREHRHGVAAGVHGVEQGVALVVGERALRGEVVDGRAR